MKRITPVSIVFLLLVVRGYGLHPLKLSVVDITYAEKRLKVKFKLFVDDAEAALGQYTKKPFSLVAFADKDIDAVTQKQIAAYLSDKFSMSINKTVVKIAFKEAYLDQAKLFTDFAAVYVELEARWPLATVIKEIEMSNTVFFETIPEQQNIANIHIGKCEHVFKFDNQDNARTQQASF